MYVYAEHLVWYFSEVKESIGILTKPLAPPLMSTAPLLGDLSVERPDKICYEPSAEPDLEAQEYLIYFITGNPGLISYYKPFLSRLHSLLATCSSTVSARFHICGHSLKGFEFSKDDENAKLPKHPLSLAEQIDFQEDLLYRHIESHRERTGNTPKVILMGHSVGAYILLELIGHHRDKIDEGEEDFDLIGGILLFPTITHIAKSPLGMVASVSVRLRACQIHGTTTNLNHSESPQHPISPSNYGCSCKIFIIFATCKSLPYAG